MSIFNPPTCITKRCCSGPLLFYRGFTLFEAVLYVGFTTFVLFLSGGFLLHILDAKANQVAAGEVSMQGNFAFAQMGAQIRSAKRVVLPLPGGASSALELEGRDGNSVQFYIEGGVLLMLSASSSVALTSPEVTVSDLEFIHVGYPEAPDAVRFRMNVAYTNPSGRVPYEVSRNFHTSDTLRLKP